MPLTLQEVKDKADQIFELQRVDMEARQSAYFDLNGVYFQGLDICVAYPSDGEEIAPDFSQQPTDQAASWTPDDFPPVVPASFAIDVYNNGVVGYMCKMTFAYTGDLWQRRIGFGDLAGEGHDWQIMPPLEI